MLKDLLVPYVNTDTDNGPIATAILLAEKFGSHLAILVTVDVPTPMPNDWGAMTYGVYVRLHEEARARAEALVEKLRKRCANIGVPVDVRMTESISLYPSNTAALQARYADLAILLNAPPNGPDSTLAHDYFQDMLMDSGQPVLVVPSKSSAKIPPRHVVIAWQPTREASRAVRDAMPFLHAAESIDVLVIDPKVGESAHGAEPGADIAAHLARHGLKVQVITRPRMSLSIGAAILDYARHASADLLVVGGYGHSRFREFVLGGVTRELLQTMDLPVLFSH